MTSDETPPPAPADPDRPDPQNSGKVEIELVHELAAAPTERHRVAVWFSTVPDGEVLFALGLADTTRNPAIGLLDASQVDLLARREDVQRVVLRPTPHL